jgi:tetratricopeptide (TPR) repeat protein
MLALLLFAAALPPAPVDAVSAGAARRLLLTPAEMFRLAEVAQGRGDVATATAVYTALESNPDSDIRAEARFRHAKLLLAQKKYRDAALLLRRLLDEKPAATAARLELARALQLLGDPDGALRQLRAVQATGLPPAVARIVDRYSEALRAERPFGASLEIALAPDSNINRATRSDTLGTVFGNFDISKDSRAKSGLGLSLNGQVYRRLPIGSDNDLLVRLSGFADLYRETRFNDLAADIAAGPEMKVGPNRLQLELGATQRWFGQKAFMRSVRLAATLSRPIGSRTLLRVSGSGAIVDNQLNDSQDGKSYFGQVSLEHALSATTGIATTLQLDRESLRDPGYSTTEWRAGVTGWRDIGRSTLTASVEFGRLHADERLMLFPERRGDRYARLSLGGTFRQLEFHGFAPIARVSIERNRSSVEFYDYRRTRSEIGVVRAF